MGQSDGGFAVLGLITQTDRFRSATASAATSDLASEYATFYGQSRYEDFGSPAKAQFLRMLKFQKGAYALGAPPWVSPQYLEAVRSIGVAEVRTPVMMIAGEQDFVPIRHTIALRANVLDLGRRLEAWLVETMAVR